MVGQAIVSPLENRRIWYNSFVGSFWEKNIVNNHFIIAVGVVGLGFLLWELKSVIVALFFAYIVMTALSPMVEKLVGWKFKRWLAVLIVYFLTLLAVLVVITPLVPFLLAQIQSLAANFPHFLARVSNRDLADLLQAEFEAVGKNTVMITKTVFSGFFSVVTVAVLSLYFLLDKRQLYEVIKNPRILQILSQIEFRLGAWIRGQLLLSFAVGLLTFIGLTILGLPFAFPLAIVAGILEIIPVIGPILSAVPAVIVALAISPATAAMIVGLYIGVQLLENNLLVPKIMQKAVGLNPAAVIVGIMVGGALFGVAGSLLAMPVILVTRTILENLQN